MLASGCRWLVTLKQELDYSYISMPKVNDGIPDTNGMVTHEKGPNPRIPVYYKNELVWGLPPTAGPVMTVRTPAPLLASKCSLI